MTVIKEQYATLAPHGKNLADVVVLAQAWKKSHTFIRRHNWYADVLELDASAINLEAQLLSWGEDVSKEDFSPKDLLLVPAPKHARWEFKSPSDAKTLSDLLKNSFDDLGAEPTFTDWGPKVNSKKSPDTENTPSEPLQKLRPLAHLTIRDQTLATAVMMCLAEAVESAQGNTSDPDLSAARSAGVVSYGNRLHCSWNLSTEKCAQAKFSWGNSRTYRQYFQDYRTFLARPRRVCTELMAQLAPRRELFVVSLDIKSFFDKVDVSALVIELKKIEENYRKSNRTPKSQWANKLFWQRVERIFKWKWREEDHQYSKLISKSEQNQLNLGLPQGLVASGFLANAYLIKFDKELDKKSKEKFEINNNIKILDYCRYVDDMRIVIEAPSNRTTHKHEKLLEAIKNFVTELLKEHCKAINAKSTLELSSNKCTITPYRTISAQSHTSSLMEMLNAELSGTFDIESLAQAAGGLDGLLRMSDQVEDTIETKPSRLSLSSIALPNTDVRDDTVKRFVATRLSQLMRHRLAMTDRGALIGSQNSSNEGVTNGRLFAHEFESAARDFIKYWAENPAQVLLLRCGLDLFPHPRLLAPVLEALSVKIFHTPLGSDPAQQEREIKVAEYALSDLLRAGAVETGFRDAEEYTEGIDIIGYREDLGILARRIISDRPESPWYLQQQTHLYLASIGDLSIAATTKKYTTLLKPYETLQRMAMYKRIFGIELKEALPLALIAQQLYPNSRRFGTWLTEGLKNTSDDSIKSNILGTVALNRPDLAIAALNGKSPDWQKFIPRAIREASRYNTSPHRARAKSKGTISLLHLMLQPNNIFSQENSILLLAEKILQHENIDAALKNHLSPEKIHLTCNDWERIPSLPASDNFLTIEIIEYGDPENPLYANPSWVSEDRAWLYGLGRILRAALTGEFDFTSRRFLVTEDTGQYSGIKSTWFMRRFGLLNSGQGLLDEPGPISPWLSGLISTLLQWPGVDIHAHNSEIGNVRTPSELLALIQARITAQRALFGHRSQTPMYVVPVDDQAPLKNRPIRVAIVQPMRPRQDEFNSKDPSHWNAGVLAEHRRHLAEICRLTHQKLKTWASAKTVPHGSKETSDPVVDIVLFPELAVHPEHISLLRRLSDKLKTNIFTGLTFLHSNKAGGIVNQGLWLIRNESPSHGRSFQYIWQGKKHPMKLEKKMGIQGYRPHVTLVELPIGSKTRTRIAAAICYDATDLDLVADLRERSDMFLVAALNQDVQTFDNMIAALHFHMYQPVILANSGEFGGSTAQVPLPKHERLVAHVHGGNQVAVSVFEIEPSVFKSTSAEKIAKEPKSPPAGYKGRPTD